MAAELITLAVIAVILLVGYFGNLIFRKTNIPSTLWLLIFGLLLGQAFHLVDRTALKGMIGVMSSLAIIVILSDGGMSLDIRETLIGAPKGVLVLIMGLFFSVASTFAIMTAFGFDKLISLFTGLTLAGTSASVIIPIITKMGDLNERVKSILSFESIGDTFTIVIALFVLDIMTGKIPTVSVGPMINPIFSGISIGFIIGVGWAIVMKKLDKEENTYAATLAILFFTYVFAESVNSSGAIACFITGLTLGNYNLVSNLLKNPLALLFDEENKKGVHIAQFFETAKYHSLISFFIRTFFFVFVGTMILITNYRGILIGALISIGLFLTRYIYVNLAMIREKGLTRFDKNTMIVMFPRGLSAAVLATVPIAKGVEGVSIIIDIVFTVIIGSNLISTVGMYLVTKKHRNGNEDKVIHEIKEKKKHEETTKKHEHKLKEHHTHN